MKAVVYFETGDSSVLQLVDRDVPEPGSGQVRVRMVRSAVNPTDWKSRSGRSDTGSRAARVANQDGAGVVDALGDGVDPERAGQRVWIW